MSKDLNLALKISVDKKEGESNLSAFNRAFKDAMAEIGKSAEEIDAFDELNKDLAKGVKQVDELDDETRQLYDTYRKGAELAADRDILGIRAHADIQKEIEETRAAYDRLKKGGKLSQAELAQAALKTEERIRELKHQTNGWVDALQDAKGSIAGLAGSVAGLATAAGYAIDFESAMADVRKVVDGTDEQFDALTARIKEMTGELPITADGLAQIAAAGGQLGVPIDKLDQFIELTARMSVAFDLSVEQAGQAVAKLSNIFNIPIDNVEALGDAINTLGNTTAAREADILDVLTRIGGTASQFKLTAIQSAALAATMIEMGATSEVAGTGINALLSKLQTANVQGPEFQRALEGMGLSAKQLADDIRANPQQALTEFLRTLSTLDDQARAETLTRLFGQEYQDDIARLLNGLDKYDASLKRITNTGQTAGAMQREFAARMQTTEAEIQLMQNGLQAIAINLGSIFLPAIRAAAVGIGDVSRAIADFVEANPGIAALATTLGTVALSAGALRLLFLSLGVVGTKAFVDVRKEVALTRLSMADLSGSVGKLGAAVRLAGTAWAAWEIGTDIGKQLHDNFEIARLAGVRLAQAFTVVMEAVGAAFEALTNPGEIGGIWDEFTAKVERINKTYQQMYEEVDAGEDVLRRNAAAATDTGNALEQAGNKAAEAAQKIRDEFAALDLTSASGVLDFTAQIDRAAGHASVLTEQLKSWISDANAADLSKFSYGINEAFKQSKLSAEKLAEYNELILRKSFDDLGLSAEAALGKISPAAKEAIYQIDNIAVTLERMGVTGEQRMAALEIAVRGAIGQTDNIAAVNELRGRIAQLGDAGDITAEQMKRLNDQLDTQAHALAQTKPGIQSVEDAMRQLGLTSQAELQKAAASAQAVVEQLRTMGAPIEDQRTAFLKYAETALAANQNVTGAQREVVIAQLQVQAAALGVTDQLAAMGDAGKDAGEKTKDGAKQAAESTKEISQAAQDSERDVQAVAASLAGWFQSVRDEVAALSEQARAAFDNKLGIDSAGPVSEIEALQQSIAAAREELGKVSIDNLQVFDPTGVNRFKNSVIEAKNETLIAFQEQKIKALDYINALESGKGVNQAFINQAQSAQQWMQLLGEEDLSQLQSAIDSANQKLLAMTDAAKSTLGSLQDELDRLQGNQDAIDKREYENKREEVQRLLEEARLYGNKEAINYYTDALKTLDQVRAEKHKQQRADDRQPARRQSSTTSELQTQKIKTVEVKIGSKSVQVLENNEQDLLDALADYGMRT
ncbi:MAG: phage tail tape measure protein [Thalassobium sp.]|nr:MAG: phage tail tape measure protein [Thalassobium sp.]